MGYYLRVTFVQNVGDTPLLHPSIVTMWARYLSSRKKVLWLGDEGHTRTAWHLGR